MNIVEKVRDFITKASDEVSGGGPAVKPKVSAEAEIVVRGPDGQVKSVHKAENSEITL